MWPSTNWLKSQFTFSDNIFIKCWCYLKASSFKYMSWRSTKQYLCQKIKDNSTCTVFYSFQRSLHISEELCHLVSSKDYSCINESRSSLKHSAFKNNNTQHTAQPASVQHATVHATVACVMLNECAVCRLFIFDYFSPSLKLFFFSFCFIFSLQTNSRFPSSLLSHL